MVAIATVARLLSDSRLVCSISVLLYGVVEPMESELVVLMYVLRRCVYGTHRRHDVIASIRIAVRTEYRLRNQAC
jgi:hypothetical protein